MDNNTLNFKEKLIDKFFEDDYLDFSKYPDNEIAEYYSRIHRNHIADFTCYTSPALAEEMKVFLKMLFLGFNDFSYRSKITKEAFLLVPFMKNYEYSSVLEMDKELLEIDFLAYRNVKETKPLHELINNVYFFLREYHDKREGLDRDIWYLDKLSLAENRTNKVSRINTINFYEIENANNRELIKKYIRYQLGGTELSVATIVNRTTTLKNFSNYYQKNFEDFTEKDATLFQEYILSTYENNSTRNRYCINARYFFDFLITKELYKGQNPFASTYRKPERRMKYSAVSDFVIYQIFNHLKLAPLDIMVMYVINFCTGMRVSDICQLEIDSLFEAKGHYFIKHKVQKMKKHQANIIPEALFTLIKQQEAIVKKDNPKGKYLFPSRTDNKRPMRAAQYRNEMKNLCAEWGIKNEDATPYEFHSHDYRHTIATTLLNDYNVDLSIIQLGVLGHTEINMSLCYAERNQSREERFQKTYVSIDGSVKRISDEVDDVFLQTTEELNNSLENMQLSNGMCMYPRKLGVCPHFDACLQCEHFRTSLDYLELHKQQLAVVNRNIPIYEANGWLPNLATAKREKEGLEKIITALEKLQKEGGNMNGINTA